MGGHGHPVASALADAAGSLASVAEVPVWSLDDLGFAATIGQAYRLIGQAQSVLLRLVGEADAAGVAARSGRRRRQRGCGTY